MRLVPPAAGEVSATGEVVVRGGNCRAVVDALERRGVTFLGPAAEPEWGGQVRAFALDPGDHLLEITRVA